MADYKKRVVDSILQDRLDAKGAVLIREPKWCGKTTTTVQKAAGVLKMDNLETKEQNLDITRLSPLRLPQGRHSPSHRRVTARVQPLECGKVQSGSA